jgi:hypothetical protein
VLVFHDGFDLYQAWYQRWDALICPTINQINPQIQQTVVRSGGGAMYFGLGQSGNGSVNGGVMAVKNIPNSATYIVGMAVRIDFSAPTRMSDTMLISFLDGGTHQVSLKVDSAGHLYFVRNGTTLIGSASTLSLTGFAWHYIEVKVTIDPSVGVCSLQVDGVNWLNLTGQNTRATSNSFTGQVAIGNLATNAFTTGYVLWIDDFYLANTSGSFNNNFLGDRKVLGLVPNGNGSTLNYTMNAAAWPSNTAVFVGRTILDTNGNYQRVITVTSDAKTGVSAPTWNASLAGTTTDNHVTWINLGAQSQFLTVNQSLPEGIGGWIFQQAQSVGDAIWDPNGNVQLCTTAGTTTGGTVNGPTWNTTVGGTTADGSVVWTNLGTLEDIYLSDATAGDQSRFTYPAIAGSTVNAVSVVPRARKDDAGTRTIRGATKSGATVADSGTDLGLSTSYQYLIGLFETDPNTSAAWTVSGVNAAEFGVKTIS